MAKLPIIIADYTNQSRISGGVANRTVAHFDELAVVGSQVAAGNVSGGVLPMSSDEYAAAMLASLGASPAAWYRAETGVPVTASGASMVADQADADNALVLPGVAGNNASAPDSAPLSITGDIDVRVDCALSDYTPSANQELVAKDATGGQFAYLLRLRATTGVLDLYWSEDGTALKQATSTAATAITDGARKWIRATLDVDNGSGAYEVKFWLSTFAYLKFHRLVRYATATEVEKPPHKAACRRAREAHVPGHRCDCFHRWTEIPELTQKAA